MNANLHMRNGRVFRFGGVLRVWSSGHDLQVHADLGETITIGGRRTTKKTLGFDDVTRFNLSDVAEITLDDEPNRQRMQVIA